MTSSLPSAIADKPELDTSFTSTGAKLYWHQESMQALRDMKGRPISAWCAPTDVCNHRCAFCSVGERVGDVLRFSQITDFIDQLVVRGLKSITFSGGGNPLIYKCKESGAGIKDCIDYAHAQGLEVAMITNGMPLETWYETKEGSWKPVPQTKGEWAAMPEDAIIKKGERPFRKSWKNLPPDTLDKLTWCRISMSGLDHNHKEQEVFVPDFDPTKTALGFSWIMSDSYEEPTHKHGWVSTPEDMKDVKPWEAREMVQAETRLPWIESQIKLYVEKHNPRYVRLLANCLQPERIPERHQILVEMAARIDPVRVFSQNKPPRQPKKCFKVLTRPCLNADGWIYACDSVVLNRTAGHKFDSVWRICPGAEVGEMLDNPSKYQMPDNICSGCVFSDAVDLINDIVGGRETPQPQGTPPEHTNFV